MAIETKQALMNMALDSSKDSIGEFVAPFLSPSSWDQKLCYESANWLVKHHTGKTIYNESDMLGDKMAKGTLHFFNAVATNINPYNKS